MRQFIERLLQTVDPPDPERAERLWAEYRAGGPKADTAFATLMAWYGGPIYRRIWGFVRSDAAEDVFQDVLVRLHRHRHKFTGFEHALRWLRGVAVTQSLNARRGNLRRTKREQAHAAGGGTVTREVEAAELGEALRAALAKLPDREREAVALVYFEGMTRQNGAAALGVHRDTMTKLLETALGRLKSALAATAIGAALTTAGVETAVAANPGLPLARLSVLAEAAWMNARSSGFAWPPARKLVPLILAGGLLAVAAAVTFSWGGFMTRTPKNVRLQVAQLEPREVPSADLVSGFTAGNGMGSSSARDITVDTAGNSYVTGSFSGTTDFDPAGTHAGDIDILTSRGSSDAYVAKYAPDNRLVWVTRMGGDKVAPAGEVITDSGESIQVDAIGNVYVTGQFEMTADFGSVNLTSAGGFDGFVAKLTSAGGVVWANRWGTTHTDKGQGVGVDSTGNVFVLGQRYDSASNNGSTAATDDGYDVLKFKSGGTADWAKWLNTKQGVTNYGDLAVDVAGNLFVTGRFYRTVDFDPGAGKKIVSSGSSSVATAFILKLTTAGNFGWVAPFVTGANGSSTIQNITLDDGGNLIVSGEYSGTVDFNPASGTTHLPANGRAFLAKLTSGGGLTWAKAIEGDNFVYVYGLDTDAAGNIYTTGAFAGSADFDPGAGTTSRTTAGRNDVFVLKWTSAGNFAWAESFGGTGNDIGRSVAVDPSGFIHFVGHFQGTVDFDPAPNVAFDLTAPFTYGNMFLVKLRQN